MFTTKFIDYRKRFHSQVLTVFIGLFVFLSVHDFAVSQDKTRLKSENLFAELSSSQNRSNESLLSIQFTNVTIPEALELLAEEIKVGFSYNPDIIPGKRVSFSMSNVPPHEVIYKLLEGTQLEPVLPPSKDVIVIREKKQIPTVDVLQQTITGTVVEANTGEPITGVTVVVSGTNIGTTTDIDGNYALDVPDDTDVLVFSYVGFISQELSLNGRTEINVELEQDVVALDEAVVTAFGLQREQRSLGTAVGRVSGDDLAEISDINVSKSLSGRVSGVQVSSSSSGPGGSSRVIIRGHSSLGGNNQPLYVVDGVPIDNTNRGSAGRWGGYDRGDGIQNFNPNDIADISVLKGPNAAALYGQRGANGVILITTKSGENREGIGIDYSSTVTMGEPWAVSYTHLTLPTIYSV